MCRRSCTSCEPAEDMEWFFSLIRCWAVLLTEWGGRLEWTIVGQCVKQSLLGKRQEGKDEWNDLGCTWSHSIRGCRNWARIVPFGVSALLIANRHIYMNLLGVDDLTFAVITNVSQGNPIWILPDNRKGMGGAGSLAWLDHHTFEEMGHVLMWLEYLTVLKSDFHRETVDSGLLTYLELDSVYAMSRRP